MCGVQPVGIMLVADGCSGEVPIVEQNANSGRDLALPEPQPAETVEPAEAAEPASAAKPAAAAAVHSDLECLLQ